MDKSSQWRRREELIHWMNYDSTQCKLEKKEKKMNRKTSKNNGRLRKFRSYILHNFFEIIYPHGVNFIVCTWLFAQSLSSFEVLFSVLWFVPTTKDYCLDFIVSYYHVTQDQGSVPSRQANEDRRFYTFMCLKFYKIGPRGFPAIFLTCDYTRWSKLNELVQLANYRMDIT